MNTTATRRIDKKTTRQIIRVSGHVVSLAPLVLLIWDFYTGGLGFDPIREVTLRTGKAAITLLVASLAITPLKMLLKWNVLHSLRRIFGVYAFVYVALHLLTFVWLDYGLSLPLIYEAIFEKPYALVGFLAFLILLPLAITSTRGWMKRLGKTWTKLHKWVYLAGILAVAHYVLLVKNAYTQPLTYAVVLGVLLLLRLKPIRQAIVRWRR